MIITSIEFYFNLKSRKKGENSIATDLKSKKKSHYKTISHVFISFINVFV
jgi:hypothetical protein